MFNITGKKPSQLNDPQVPLDGDQDWIVVETTDGKVVKIHPNDIVPPTGASAIAWYNAGNGVMVYADGPGIQTAKSGGIVSLNVPDTINLLAFRFIGGAADLNSGELRIIIDGGKGAGTDFNTANSNLIHPIIMVQNRTQVLPTDPFLQRPDDAGDSINIFDEPFANAGEVSMKITGLSGDFAIKATF